MNKKEFLCSLNDVYCRIGRTTHGVGVIAIRHIPKGTNPFKNCDRHSYTLKIPQTELDAYDAPESVKNKVRDFFALQDGIYYVSDHGVDAIDQSYFLNHSNDPNVMTSDTGETFITSRDIKTGEELTSSYDQYDTSRHFERK